MIKTENYERYPLYLIITGLSLLIMTILIGLFSYLLWPGLLGFGLTFALVGEGVLLILPIIWWFLYLILLGSTFAWWSTSALLLRISNRFVYLVSLISIGWIHICGISKNRFRQSMIDLINRLVARQIYKVEPHRILLLTPHCLQEQSCVHKVTHNVYNCKQCGSCPVGDLLGLAKEYGCQFVVVTGGTLARLQVKEAKPKAIVAIACERDLASGMADVFPIPVIGVLNERPNGPCCNTRVDIGKVRNVVEGLIDEEYSK